MQYSLACGPEQLSVELPEKNVVKVLKIKSAAALEDPINSVFDVLEEPVEAEPLAAIAEGKKSACVVICDSTRPIPSSQILPPILQTLEDAGVDLPKITILIATGLNRNSSAAERLEITGEDIALRKFKVSDHSAKKIHQHEYLGVTKNGTPIWVDRRYLEAEIRVITGMIEPHSIIGFSGGRHSICPGIAATDTIAACYSHKILDNENVRPGSIEDNPIHHEQMEIARKAGCDFIVNVLLNEDHKISKVVGGHLNHAFQKGVEIARKIQTDTVEKQVDIVVTTGGGAPFDRTWYQSIRGIIGALDILKPGGTIILAAGCDEGLGNRDLDEAVEKYAALHEMVEAITSKDGDVIAGQWQLFELAKVLKKGKVKVVTSGIPAETLEKFSVIPCTTVEEAVAGCLEEYGEAATIAVIPAGPCVLALAKNKEPELAPATQKKSDCKSESKKTETKKITEKPTDDESVAETATEETTKTAKKTVKKAAAEEKTAGKTGTTKKVAQKTETEKAVKKTVKKATKKS